MSSEIQGAHGNVATACKTKVVGTIGPATQAPEQLRALIKAGVSILRLNLSHCSHAFCQSAIQNLRAVQTPLSPVAVLLDLNGTKLRIGHLPAGAVQIRHGQSFQFVLGGEPEAPDAVSANIPPDVVKPGDKIYIDDGLLAFSVVQVHGTAQGEVVTCTVRHRAHLLCLISRPPTIV